jgi:ferredoxin
MVPSRRRLETPFQLERNHPGGLRERLERFRSLKLFMDICVRCGACADKCHFFIGAGTRRTCRSQGRAAESRCTGKNSPRPESLGKFAGARDLDDRCSRIWWYYFFQCSECRRCSLFCPYGIDTAEITIIARELTNLIGLNTDWISAPVANCYRTGNHLGIQPHAYKDMIDFFVDDIEESPESGLSPPFNRKGAEILFITPSGDVFADPGTYTCMGYLMLFHYLQNLGTGSHVEHLCLRGRATSGISPPTKWPKSSMPRCTRRPNAWG